MRLVKLGFLILSLVMLCGCPEYIPELDMGINIVNNSREDIV